MAPTFRTCSCSTEVASADIAHGGYFPGLDYSSEQATLGAQTQHALDSHTSRFWWNLHHEQHYYPYDRYFAQVLIHGLHSETNESIPLGVVLMDDTVDNFDVHVFDAAFVRTNKPAIGQSSSAYGLRIAFERTLASNRLAILLFFINWLLTATVLYFAVSACVGTVLADGVLILPITVILTIPALRALWVGAPAFGMSPSAFGMGTRW